ncbi:MAG: hypothetical protein P8183_18600 [Anaerolineae bacterium]
MTKTIRNKPGIRSNSANHSLYGRCAKGAQRRYQQGVLIPLRRRNDIEGPPDENLDITVSKVVNNGRYHHQQRQQRITNHVGPNPPLGAAAIVLILVVQSELAFAHGISLRWSGQPENYKHICSTKGCVLYQNTAVWGVKL